MFSNRLNQKKTSGPAACSCSVSALEVAASNPTNSIGFHCKVGFFHFSTTPVVGVTLGELEKLIFLNKTKRNLSFRVTWCFFNVPVQELQTSRVATPQKELIYTLIHGRDPIPCRTTYIEYKSQGEDSLFFKIGTPPNSIGFHCKVGFFVLFHCSTAPVVGVTLGELEKIIFFNKTKINLSFG